MFLTRECFAALNYCSRALEIVIISAAITLAFSRTTVVLSRLAIAPFLFADRNVAKISRGGKVVEIYSREKTHLRDTVQTRYQRHFSVIVAGKTKTSPGERKNRAREQITRADVSEIKSRKSAKRMLRQAILTRFPSYPPRRTSGALRISRNSYLSLTRASLYSSGATRSKRSGCNKRGFRITNSSAKTFIMVTDVSAVFQNNRPGEASSPTTHVHIRKIPARLWYAGRESEVLPDLLRTCT